MAAPSHHSGLQFVTPMSSLIGEKSRAIRKRARPTLVGFGISLKTFYAMTFSIPRFGQPSTDTQGADLEAIIFHCFRSLSRAPAFHSLLQPDLDTLEEGKFEVDYSIYFFPIRSLAEGETYDPEQFTLNPTERDRNALGRFTSWIEGHGGKFDVANATFMAAPCASTTGGWGYYVC